MALEPGLVVTVVADLDRVTSADASTVSWLLRADARVRLTGARFVAVTGKGRAGDVLRLTGVGRRLDVVAAATRAERGLSRRSRARGAERDGGTSALRGRRCERRPSDVGMNGSSEGWRGVHSASAAAVRDRVRMPPRD